MHESFRRKVEQVLPELEVNSFTYLGEGEDNIAFEANDSLIVRFTKHGIGPLEREAAILGFVQSVSPLPTPVVKYACPNDGFIVYDKLPGTPLIKLIKGTDINNWPGFSAELGNLLGCLNGADTTPIKAYLQTEPDSLKVWLSESKGYFSQAKKHIPRRYQESIKAFLAAPITQSQFEPVFTHNDLGIEHVLVDAPSKRITGIIDWGDAALADPAHDFGKIYRDLGPKACRAALQAYPLRVDAGLEERIIFYARCEVLEDLMYGIERQSDEYITKNIASLSWLFGTSQR